MLYELRDSVPTISDRWSPVRDLFLEGRSRAAWDKATALRSEYRELEARDYVLFMEIARACAAHRSYFRFSRLAIRACPDDPYVQLYHARVHNARGMFMQSVDAMLQNPVKPIDPLYAEWSSQLASLFGDPGFEASSRKWLEVAEKAPGAQYALPLYNRSCACEGMRDWDHAIHLARASLAEAPRWMRVRTHLINCLLARGAISEAQALIEEGRSLGIEDAGFNMLEAMLSFSQGRLEEARGLMTAFLRDWPQADYIPWVRRTLCILLVELNRCEEARELAAGEEDKLGLPAINEDMSSAAHHYISLPLIAQNKNQCVPTTVAMSAFPQGKALDPDRLFKEMKGREGTALWRMRRWAEEHHFCVVPIRFEKTAIVELLQRNIPLIGVLEHIFNSHVEVVCGYHDGLDVLYVRDPADWAPLAWPYEAAVERYELHGALLAIIDKERVEEIALAERCRSESGQALMDLTEAVAEGRREDADAAFARIGDEETPAFLRDLYSLNVVLTPKQFQERMKVWGKDETSNPLIRFRALLSLGLESAQEVIDPLLEKEGHKLGVVGRRYLETIRFAQEGAWEKARQVNERLLLFHGNVSTFWEIQSDILAELGLEAESRDALDKAIELEPFRLALREKQLKRSASRLTFHEYLKEFDSLLAEDAEDKSLLRARAEALLDGPDGLAYEAAVQNCIHWFPRDPRGHTELMSWYLGQGRSDLYEACRERARSLMPEEFPEGSLEPGDESEATRADTPLPEEKPDLLHVIWDLKDPRRPRAIEALDRMEEEGVLQWYERAQFLAHRLIPWQDGEVLSQEETRARLPETVPGAPHWFAGAVAEIVGEYNFSPSCMMEIYEWMLRIVPKIKHYPECWFSALYLLEKTQRIEPAVKACEQFLETYPAFASTLYRLGMMKYQQADYPNSRHYAERALAVNPGHPGSMRLLRAVCDVLGDEGGSLEALRTLRVKYPYDYSLFSEELILGDSEGFAESDHALFGEERLAVSRARLAAERNRGEEARTILAGLDLEEDKNEDLYEEYLKLRMELAQQQEASTEELLTLCDMGLKRWPDSTRLLELKAQYLTGSNQPGGDALLLDVLHTGEPSERTAYQYLSFYESDPVKAARDAVDTALEERREELAVSFGEVMSYAGTDTQCEAYLDWACSTFPDSGELLWKQVMFHYVGLRPREAVRLARALYKKYPDRSQVQWLLGRCLIETTPKEALGHLQAVCKENRSAEYLFDLARCYQIMGRQAEAQKTHWDVLGQNPYAAASLTNLFVSKVDYEKLWPYVTPMLEKGHGVEEEYFLVVAVFLARNTGHTLPGCWLPLALDRLGILAGRKGFGDELPRLKKALLAWLSVHPDHRPEGFRVDSGIIERLMAKTIWPGQKWVG